MFQTPSPLSRIKDLVPVDPAWLAKWECAWKQGQSKREQARREAAQRAQKLRKVVLF